MEQRVPRSSGIFYGWFLVAALFTIWTVVFGIQYSFGVFFRSIQDALGCSRGAISWAMTIHLLGFAAMMVAAGWINGRYNIRCVYSLAAFGFGLPLALCSQVTQPWQLYLLYGLLSISTGIFGPYVFTLVTRWFAARRGLALGLTSAGAGFGTLVGAPLSNWLIAAYGWRETFVILGVGCTLILLVCAQFAKNPSTGSTLVADDAVGDGSPGPPAAVPGMTLREAVRSREIRLIISGSAAAQIASRAIVVHIAPYAGDVGISPFLAAMALSTIGCGSFLGRIVMGFIQDRIGAKNSMIICQLAMAASLFVLPFVRTDLAFLGFAIVFGLAYGGDVPQTPALTVQCFGVASMGIIYALVAGGANVLSSLGPLTAGYLFDLTESYTAAFLGAGGLLLFGAWSIAKIRTTM